MESCKPRLLSILCAVFALIAVPATLPAQSAENRTLANGIAAVVNGQIITIDQIRAEMNPIIDTIRREARTRADFDRRLEALQAEVLQSLIDRILIVDEFEKRGAMIPSTYIESEYDDFIRREFDGDRSRFLNYLRENGQSPRQFRTDLRKRLIVGAMRQENRRSASEISPERIEAFYEANLHRFYQTEGLHLRQIILMPLADEGLEPLRQTARTIMSELESGAEFADLARRFSQDEMRRRGGDYGWVQRDDIRSELSGVAFGLEAGQYSEPIELGGNIFILYAEAKREEMVQPLTLVREAIENILADEIMRDTQRDWISKLRDRAHIRIFI